MNLGRSSRKRQAETKSALILFPNRRVVPSWVPRKLRGNRAQKHDVMRCRVLTFSGVRGEVRKDHHLLLEVEASVWM